MASLEADLGVIKDARRRQRHRRAMIGASVLLTVFAAALLVTKYPGHVNPPPPPPPKPPATALSTPGRLFSRPPYMGVACPVANSVACDRVGLAVWLRRPAVSVSATIAGEPVKLDWAGDRSPGFALRHDHTPRTAFDGYLQPAGITTALHVVPDAGSSTWLGGNTPSPIVSIRIDYGRGHVAVTRERVPLMAGWG